MRGIFGWTRASACCAIALVALAAIGLVACKDDNKRSGATATDTRSGAATTDTRSPGEPVRAERLSFLVAQELPKWDPTQVAVVPEGIMLLALEPLVIVRPDGSFAPNLATKFSTPDPRTYTYEIRRGVKFWDGSPMTIDDVIYSLKMHTGPDNGSVLARAFYKVKSVAQTGSNEVTVKLNVPDTRFNTWVAQTPVVSKRVREASLDEIGSPDAMNVGTGPYRWGAVKAGEEIELKRNDSYWGPKPGIGQLTLRFVADSSARLLAVRSGEVDGSLGVPSSDVKQYESIPHYHVIEGPDPALQLLSMNNARAPWNDAHVRRAVAMALDKEGLVNAVARGAGQVAQTLPNAANLRTVLAPDELRDLNAKVAVRHDVEAAKAELAQSSQPHGFSGQLLVAGDEVDSNRAAQAIVEQLKPLGIRLQIKVLPGTAFGDTVFAKHAYGIAVTGFNTDSKDPSVIAEALANSKAYTDLASYKNARVDRAFEQLTRLPLDDKEGRAKALTAALEQIASDAPYLPLYHGVTLASLRDGLNYPGYDGLWWLTRWPEQLRSTD
jgi:peptide/nickel transport system substrate-binding protein